MYSSMFEAMISLMTSEPSVAGLRVTVRVMVPLTSEPSEVVAVMVTVPGPSVVTVPLASTVATCSSLDDQFNSVMMAVAGCTTAFTVVCSPATSSVASAVSWMAVALTILP